MFHDLQLFPDLFEALTTKDDQGRLLLNVLMLDLDQDVLGLIEDSTESITHVWHLLATERGQYDDATELVQAVKDKYGLDLQNTRLNLEFGPFLVRMAGLQKSSVSQEDRLELLAYGRRHLMLLLARTGNAAANIGASGKDTYEIKRYLEAIYRSDDVLRRELGLE